MDATSVNPKQIDYEVEERCVKCKQARVTHRITEVYDKATGQKIDERHYKETGTCKCQ